MKVALVYDRVNKWGGAERDLLALHELFPQATLFTSVYNKKKAPWVKVFPLVFTSFLQKIPKATDKHEHFPYLMPMAFESFDFSRFDLVISVTSEAAKGIITKPDTLHVCYMLTPTRYLWSHHDFYFKNPPTSFKKYPLFKTLSKPLVSYLKAWDKIAAQRPDVIISQSTEVQKRVKKYYGRDSQIIFPPVEADKFKSQKSKVKSQKSDFFLYVSRLIPYKRADLAIEAFNELGFPLVIVGVGSEKERLKKMAKTNIKFINELTDKELASYYHKAKALVFPQDEDFGLVVLEANACGTPVIAFKSGGALDTVIPGKTGVFFKEQNKESLIAAVKKFEKMKFDRRILIKNGQKFSKERFKKEFYDLIKNL